jgi:hypothetical protein
MLATTTTSDCIDTDGDGYGWNGVTSCTPFSNTTQSHDSLPVCALDNSDSDGDGDGYGFENGTSCIVNHTSTTQLCVDSDGDGFGWNG